MYRFKDQLLEKRGLRRVAQNKGAGEVSTVPRYYINASLVLLNPSPPHTCRLTRIHRLYIILWLLQNCDGSNAQSSC